MSKPDAETGSAGASLRDVSVDPGLDPCLDPGPDFGVVIRTAALMKGHREVTILHAGERYRLRITANDKLILTK
ncbi:hemin uptake protein HemP [Methylobacterium soli]|uniref:Hemin uptake protein HemP n=1 Tax=Methylobacterium soli TaxID=553447 RepID=A0A6L3T1T9_9HYPH|nr:hemin uptake protein HemP [Methylobacterium soli]KAB1079808.1 hemin uptake protein HemP [Methylobacterium soli]